MQSVKNVYLKNREYLSKYLKEINLSTEQISIIYSEIEEEQKRDIRRISFEDLFKTHFGRCNILSYVLECGNDLNYYQFDEISDKVITELSRIVNEQTKFIECYKEEILTITVARNSKEFLSKLKKYHDFDEVPQVIKEYDYWERACFTSIETICNFSKHISKIELDKLLNEEGLHIFISAKYDEILDVLSKRISEIIVKPMEERRISYMSGWQPEKYVKDDRKTYRYDRNGMQIVDTEWNRKGV